VEYLRADSQQRSFERAEGSVGGYEDEDYEAIERD
jgi:hypothetical protein